MYATPGLSPPLTFGAESAAEPESRMVVGTYGSLGGPEGDDMAGVASARKTADDAARLKFGAEGPDIDRLDGPGAREVDGDGVVGVLLAELAAGAVELREDAAVDVDV